MKNRRCVAAWSHILYVKTLKHNTNKIMGFCSILEHPPNLSQVKSAFAMDSLVIRPFMSLPIKAPLIA